MKKFLTRLCDILWIIMLIVALPLNAIIAIFFSAFTEDVTWQECMLIYLKLIWALLTDKEKITK